MTKEGDVESARADNVLGLKGKKSVLLILRKFCVPDFFQK